MNNVSTVAREDTHIPVRHLCDRCGKRYAWHQSLWRHKNRVCTHVFKCQDVSNKKYVKPTILKWNGKSWETRSENVHHQINLGCNLSDLLKRGAIKHDALNSRQKEYVQKYDKLFRNLKNEIDEV